MYSLATECYKTNKLRIWTGLQPTGPFEAGPVRQISGPAEIIK